jgi:3-hydroxyisobutyrate dehydrogenase-like beta-hydroxyacid dehydrogenase
MDIHEIGVIGLGMMGTPISSLLLKAGYAVRGYDIAEKQIADLVSQGLTPASSPKEAATGAQLVILSLANWAIVREVVEGDDGVLQGAHTGQIVLDMSTSPPAESIAMAEHVALHGVEWMDVPISGAAAQARVGNMVFMAGGKRAVFEQVRPVLDRIGKKTVYVGKHGDAAMLKLVVNLILFLTQGAAIEGLALGLKAGLDPKIMYDAITSGAAASDLVISRGKDILAGRFEPKGQLSVAVKDMGLILDRAKQLGVPLPVGGLYYQLLLQAQYQGWDEQDATCVMNIYEKLAGISRGGQADPK